LELDPVTALGTVGAGAIFAANGSQPVSREQATAIGAHEQKLFGSKTTDHVRSPYSNPDFVRDVANAGPAEYAPGAKPCRRPVAFEHCRRRNAAADAHNVSGQRVDVGPGHTAHPVSLPHSVKDSVHTPPAETSTKPLHTGHATPDLSGLSKPTGTAIHQPNAADLMTEKTRAVHAGIPANPNPHTAYRPQTSYAEFDSFEALKDYLGSAGEGRDWHHIVGQHDANVAKFGPRAIHNMDNIVSVDRAAVHRPLNGQYSTKPEEFGGKTVRDRMAGKSYEEQRAFDLFQLDKLGVTVK